METSKITPTTILAAIDYSDTSSLVVERAIEAARQRQPVELHFLHVNHGSPENDDEQEALRAELLEWLGARLRNDNGMPYAAKVVSHEASGDPAHVIVDMAGDLLADLVIVGTHGRKGVERMVMGSVSESVLRKCGCAVLVVRAKAHSESSRSWSHPVRAVSKLEQKQLVRNSGASNTVRSTDAGTPTTIRGSRVGSLSA